VAVAPHQVYGPQDLLFLPAFLENARKGRLRIFGGGRNVVSFTHVDNICHALFLAGEDLLRNGSASEAAGQFFVVTDGDSGVRNLWDTIDSAVTACDMPSLHTKLHLPVWLIMSVARCGSLFHRITGRTVQLTPFAVTMVVIDRCAEQASCAYASKHASLLTGTSRSPKRSRYLATNR
jgi:nucleoside-diphosphate-sugar epimerase